MKQESGVQEWMGQPLFIPINLPPGHVECASTELLHGWIRTNAPHIGVFAAQVIVPIKMPMAHWRHYISEALTHQTSVGDQLSIFLSGHLVGGAE